jgi:hypothetical protein
MDGLRYYKFGIAYSIDNALADVGDFLRLLIYDEELS